MKLPKPPDSAAGDNTPKTTWDKIITSTPVVMTVLATLLAGLSSSESNQAQYYRSLSAQNQSKAGDQWNFFQAKKLRSANAATSVKLMRNLGDVAPLTAESLTGAAAHLVAGSASTQSAMSHAQITQDEITSVMADPDVKVALEMLTGSLPPASELNIADEKVRTVYVALKQNHGEATAATIFGSVDPGQLHNALKAADESAQVSDDLLQPAITGIAKIEKLLDHLASVSVSVRRSATQAASRPATGATDRESPGVIRQLAADFAVAQLRFDASRYDREARMNQQTAYLYEVAVRKTSWQSDRSLSRSRYFFYGMLAAQAGVMIATFSLAVRERSWLWTLAATIGVMATSYAAYVYLFT